MLELMVVVLIFAIASGVVALAMRDSEQDRVEQEGVRLAALLESARSQARVDGAVVAWEPLRDGGFHFVGLPAPEAAQLPTHWLDPDVQARIVGAPRVLLGPEPLLPAQRIELRLGDHAVAVGTDGLAPFEVLGPDGAAPAGAAP